MVLGAHKSQRRRTSFALLLEPRGEGLQRWT
jgi:hypothetical protein